MSPFPQHHDDSLSKALDPVLRGEGGKKYASGTMQVPPIPRNHYTLIVQNIFRDDQQGQQQYHINRTSPTVLEWL